MSCYVIFMSKHYEFYVILCHSYVREREEREREREREIEIDGYIN